MMGRYDDRDRDRDSSDEQRMSPDRLRRRIPARTPSPNMPRVRYISPHRDISHRDEYVRVPREPQPHDRGHLYKVLCVSPLNPKASDEFIKDFLFREYKKFGDCSIRISHDLEERVAYVCFRMSDDAREAKHAKPRIVLYDKVALVEPVYESRSKYEYKRSMSPEYERPYYGKCLFSCVCVVTTRPQPLKFSRIQCRKK